MLTSHKQREHDPRRLIHVHHGIEKLAALRTKCELVEISRNTAGTCRFLPRIELRAKLVPGSQMLSAH